MADAAPGVTTGYTLSATASTAIKTNTKGSPNRRLIMISNLDAAITVYVAFGTNNHATLPANGGAGHPIVAGATMILGGPSPIGSSGLAGIICPPGDVAAIAASGTPVIAVTVSD
jgi:hypothetical protein